MWRKILVVNILISSSFCLHQYDVKLSVEYFSYREIKTVCLLICEEDKYWSHDFSKLAFKKGIAVSRMKISKTITNFNNLQVCLSQTLTFVKLGVLIDSKCPSFDEILNFASKNKMFDTSHKWLIMSDYEPMANFKDNTLEILNVTTNLPNNTDMNINNKYQVAFNISETVSIVENLNISVDSDIIIVLNKGDLDYEIYEAFNFGKIQNGKIIVELIGFWNEDTGLIMLKNLNSYKYYERWDFQQLTMRMIVVFKDPPKIIKPEMIIGRVVPPGVARITQTSATILHEVAKMHNFRYTYAFADRWIGTFKPENTMVVASSLYYEFQDISPLIRVNPYIFGKVDIVHPPVSFIETRYYYQIPTFGPGKFENQFLRPLTTASWLCSLAAIALGALAILLAAKIEHRPLPCQYAVFSVIASLCQQFFDDTSIIRRVSQARRMAVFVTGVSCVLIYNYYTSSVVSWLLSGPPPSINSLEELLESPLELIYEDIGYTRSWLQDPTYYFNKKNMKIEDKMRQEKVFSRKKGEPLLIAPDKGIKMVKAGGYAYHTDADTANRLISREFDQMELCELGSLGSMDKTELYAVLQKNSPYKEFFVWSLARLSERGVISCIQRRTTSETVACEGSSPRALALGGAAPAFLLLLFGCLLASVIMLFERILYRQFAVQIV